VFLGVQVRDRPAILMGKRWLVRLVVLQTKECRGHDVLIGDAESWALGEEEGGMFGMYPSNRPVFLQLMLKGTVVVTR
jgi:hypothetical protein